MLLSFVIVSCNFFRKLKRARKVDEHKQCLRYIMNQKHSKSANLRQGSSLCIQYLLLSELYCIVSVFSYFLCSFQIYFRKFVVQQKGFCYLPRWNPFEYSWHNFEYHFLCGYSTCVALISVVPKMFSNTCQVKKVFDQTSFYFCFPIK